MQKSKKDVTAVIAYCCVRLQAKPKHIHKPKYCQPTREQSAAFNTVIAQYMQETTRRDIGVFLQAIQDAEKRCFTEVPLKQRRPYISRPTWNKILMRNQAHEQSNWATLAQLNAEIKRDARKDKRKI